MEVKNMFKQHKFGVLICMLLVILAILVGFNFYIYIQNKNFKESISLNQRNDVDYNNPVYSMQFKKILYSGLIPCEEIAGTYKLYTLNYLDDQEHKQFSDNDHKVLNTDLSDFNQGIKDFKDYTYLNADFMEDSVQYVYSHNKSGSEAGNKNVSENNRELTIQEKIQSDNLDCGTYGRIYLPSVNVSFMLNDALYSNDKNSLFQQWVEKNGYGAVAQYGVQKVICSNILKDLSCLINISNNDVIYIKYPNNNVEGFKCVDGGLGHVEHNNLIYGNRCLTGFNGGGLTLYSYMDSERYNINVRLFQPV